MGNQTDYEKAKAEAEKMSFEGYTASILRGAYVEHDERLAHKAGFRDGYELGLKHGGCDIPEAGERVGDFGEEVNFPTRARIAAMAMQGLLSNALWVQGKTEFIRQEHSDDIDRCAEALSREIAEDAVEFADALIAELGKNQK